MLEIMDDETETNIACPSDNIKGIAAWSKKIDSVENNSVNRCIAKQIHALMQQRLLSPRFLAPFPWRFRNVYHSTLAAPIEIHNEDSNTSTSLLLFFCSLLWITYETGQENQRDV